jgi:hypothetical protein
MKTLSILILITLSSLISWGQINCVQHWSHNKSQIVALDGILASISLQRIDTIYCDSFTIKTRLNPKWYIDFYTKHFGDYFSNPRCVCFAMFHFREKSDSIINEMHITQFVLTNKQVNAFKKKYGAIAQKKMTHKIEAYTSYKYIVKEDIIYFVSTETYALAHRKDSFFEDVVTQIQRN